jgi:hypothetical protein
VVLDRLDVESKGWANDAGVLPVDLENDGCLPRVVQAPETNTAEHNIESAIMNQCRCQPIEESDNMSTRSEGKQEPWGTDA